MFLLILHPLVNLVQWLPSVERVTLRQKLTSAHYPKTPYQNQYMLNKNCVAVYHVARPYESSFFFLCRIWYGALRTFLARPCRDRCWRGGLILVHGWGGAYYIGVNSSLVNAVGGKARMGCWVRFRVVQGWPMPRHIIPHCFIFLAELVQNLQKGAERIILLFLTLAVWKREA